MKLRTLTSPNLMPCFSNLPVKMAKLSTNEVIELTVGLRFLDALPA